MAQVTTITRNGDMIMKPERRELAVVPPKCDEIGRVYRDNLLMKKHLSGRCVNSLEFMIYGGGDGQVFNDPLGWFNINRSLPAIESGNYSFEDNFSGYLYSGFVLPIFGRISRGVIDRIRISVADSTAFTGSLEFLRIDPFGESSSMFLDVSEAVNPKSEFGWLYEFNDLNILMDEFTIMQYVEGSGGESVNISLRFRLIQNSLMMRKL